MHSALYKQEKMLQDIGEMENCPSDSLTNEEEMVTGNVVIFFYAGKVGFCSKYISAYPNGL